MFYSDCGRLYYSFKLFCRMAVKNTVSWNTLISGCVSNGEVEVASIVLHEMQKEAAKLDVVTLISIIPGYN